MAMPKEVIHASMDIVFAFGKSELGYSMPTDVTYVLIPNDNPLLAEINTAAAERAKAKGEEVLFVQASRTGDSLEYDDFRLPPSREASEVLS